MAKKRNIGAEILQGLREIIHGEFGRVINVPDVAEARSIPDPTLYAQFGNEDAKAFFGKPTEAHSLCDGQWILFPHVTLCFATLGDPPKMSHFLGGNRFCWVADKPYQVRADEHIRFVPKEVVAGRQRYPPIRLFVKRSETENFWYVGKLGPSHMQKAPDRENCGEAHFDLMPTLPSKFWIELGGFTPGDLDHATVDEALARLQLETTVEDRIQIIRRVVEYWHGSINTEDGMTEADLREKRIPYPLYWWYRWAGRRKNILRGQNYLLLPDDLKCKDGLLVFYGENQWCYEWATEFDRDDPPVYGRGGPSAPWKLEGMTLTQHLILACLFEAIMCHARYGASSAWLEPSAFTSIVEQVPPIAIGPWHWGGEARFYAKNGAFMYSMTNTIRGEKGYSVWVGAKTEHPLQFLKPYLDKSWEWAAV